MSLVWLCKTKIWWKSKLVLYGCRYLLYGYRRFIVYIKADDIYKEITVKYWN